MHDCNRHGVARWAIFITVPSGDAVIIPHKIPALEGKTMLSLFSQPWLV